MTNKFLTLAVAATAAFAFTGCDDAYDLANVDTTAQVKVTDLTIPVNFDQIYLKNILKPSENSSLKEREGEYYIEATGRITSSPVEIAAQHIAAPHVDATVRQIFEIPATEDPSLPGGEEESHTYSVTDITGSFSYTKTDIPAEIQGLEAVGVEWQLGIDVTVEDRGGQFRSLSLSDIVLGLPKGLTTTDSRYNPLNGHLTLGDITVPRGQNTVSFNIAVTKVDLTAWDSNDFTFTPATQASDGSVHLAGTVGVVSGAVTATVLVGTGTPSDVYLTMQPVLSDIDITSFTGSVAYTFKDFHIPSVSISDIPDLLGDNSTDIILANPQLYLSLNNPMASYGLEARSGIELTPMRKGVASAPISPDGGKEILVGTGKGVAGPYGFCISPQQPTAYLQGYEGADYIRCTSLSDIVSGSGIPSEIKVDLPGASIVPGKVTDFRLGRTIGSIEGEYTFYCPLQLKEGSAIVYADTIDGWNDDTVDRIEITSLRLQASVTNELPFEVQLSGYPLSKNADGTVSQSIDPSTGRPVEITPVTVAAGTTVPIETCTEGTVVRLDGIRFTARASVTEEDKLLAPETAISLTGIKVTVSGSYTDKL